MFFSICEFTAFLEYLRFFSSFNLKLFIINFVCKIFTNFTFFFLFMKCLKKIFAIIIVNVLFYSALNAQFYNGLQMTFGKNRVQYTNEKIWSYYSWQRFDTYFYQNGKELAIMAARYADKNLPLIEKKIDYYLDGKIQFVVFNSLTDLKQSNIGLASEQIYNIGGNTQIIGKTVVLHFNGNYTDFEAQIKFGIASVLVNQLLFGGEISSNIKNSSLLFLPQWYVEGLKSFIAHDWSFNLDNITKNGILSRKYKKFNHLAGDDAKIAGHSIWNFVKEQYGEQSVSNILYMTKISRSVENGFLYVLGLPFKQLISDWQNFYVKKYLEDIDNRVDFPAENQIVLKKFKKDQKIHQFVASPDGKYLAFAVDELNKKSIFLVDLQTSKRKRIFKMGSKIDEIADMSYPILAWHPRSDFLTFIVEQKGIIQMFYYFVDDKKLESQAVFGVEKIHDFSYAPNGQSMVVSATIKGQSDIFIYHIASKTFQALTNDVFDDLQPRFVKNGDFIAFVSNRINDTLSFQPLSYEKNSSMPLKSENYNLFLFNVKNQSNLLWRVTDFSVGNASQPMSLNKDYVQFLSDANGINNRYAAKIDSAISHIDTVVHYRYFTDFFPLTNYPYSIVEHDFITNSNKISQIVFFDNKYHLFLLPKTDTDFNLNSNNIVPTNFARNLEVQYEIMNTKVEPSVQVEVDRQNYPLKDTTKVDVSNFVFRGVVRRDGTESSQSRGQVRRQLDTLVHLFEVPRQRNYDVEYQINNIVSQLDYNFINYSYQPFMGGGPVFNGLGANAFLKIGINDLLEDYRFVGGVRLSFDLRNNEYLFGFENYKYRWDRQFIFHRQGYDRITNEDIITNKINNFHYIVKYPFSNVLSFRSSLNLKQIKMNYLSFDNNSLRKPSKDNFWAGAKTELVFDNTRSPQLNIFYGQRFKIWLEYFQFLSKENKNLIVAGFDYRNYTKIHKNFIWANRFAGSSSLGNSKLIYFLGGIDSWLIPRFDEKVNINYEQNYAFQALATNMRGFKQNIRNGNTFLVYNSELRLPVFRYFINRPLRSEFLNNFQIVGFADVGSAWEGWNPFSENNSLFIHTVNKQPFNIVVRRQKNPIVGGFGPGLRTKLFGYFIRTDLAWGVEDGKINKPMFYLSLSMDF